MGQLFDKHIMHGLSDAEVEARLKQVVPVLRKDGEFYEVDITGVDRRHTAFLWDPKPGPAIAKGLYERCYITTFHTFGAPVFWKPSLAEVVAQIEPDLIRLYKARYFFLQAPPPSSQFAYLLDDGTLAYHVPAERRNRDYETLHTGCLSLLTEQ